MGDIDQAWQNVMLLMRHIRWLAFENRVRSLLANDVHLTEMEEDSAFHNGDTLGCKTVAITRELPVITLPIKVQP